MPKFKPNTSKFRMTSPLQKRVESKAKGYNKDKGYFQGLLKATQENPNPNSYSKKDISKHTKNIHTRARQVQVLDYMKKSLTTK